MPVVRPTPTAPTAVPPTPGPSAGQGSSTYPPEAPLPPGAILALSLAGFGSSLSLRVSDPLLPQLSAEFGVTIGTVAAVVTVFSLAYGLAQLFFGPVGDRHGKYRVIAWGSVACVVTSLLCALAPGFTSLLGARLLAGATAASIIPLAMAWIGDVVSYERRQPVLARFLLGQILGISGGALLGGYAADHGLWRLPFVVIAAVFAIDAVLLFRMLGRLPERALRSGAGQARPRVWQEFARVIERPWARRVLATVFCEGFCLFGAFAFVATHLHQRHGLSLGAAGAIVMLYGLGGVVFALMAGRLVRRLGETGLAIGGTGLIVLAMLVIGLTPVWTWAAPACFVCGLGFYMLHNTLQTNATQMAPERRGAAVSAFASCFFLGQAFGVAVAGALVSRIGTGGVLVLGAVGMLGVGLNFARWRRVAARWA